LRPLTSKPNLEKIWTILFLVFFLFVVLFVTDTSLLLAVVLVAFCAVLIWRVNLPKFALCLGLAAFAVRLVVVLVVKTPPASDFWLLFSASQGILNGDYSFLDTRYFQLWPYQTGIAAFHALLLCIWNNILVIKLFNCLVGAGTTVLVYLIAKEFAGEKASRLAALIYCFLPFPLLYVPVLTNQFPASFLIYLGVYFLISSRMEWKHWVRILVFAALLAVANALRPESIIPLFSTALYLLLTMNRNNLKQRLFELGILIVTYFVLTKLISGLFIITGLSPNGLTSSAPHWKFVLGFNHDTFGRYANADTPYLDDAAAAWELVKERILVPIPQLLRLFKNKIAFFWGKPDLSWSFSYCAADGLPFLNRTISVTKWLPILTHMSTYLFLLLYILVLVGCLWYVKRTAYNSKILLLVNQVFVTFGVYLLIEVQPRYAYHIQISVAILAALGIQALSRFLLRKVKAARQPEPPAS